ncbi:MAG TPA: hypothetical protein VGS12_02175 [Caulobacteraceae bacterium]|nr:hypothetical protein [Caulobacteraceae bacterium]
MRLVLFTAAAASALSLSGPARADPRLDEKVYDPFVERRVGEIEVRQGSEFGGPLGGADTAVLEAEYGVSDRVSLALVGAMGRAPGGEERFGSLGLEGVAWLGQVPAIGVDTGIYLEYSRGFSGQSGGPEAKLLLAKTAGRFQGLANLILERPLGVPRGEGYASYGYALSATWRTKGAFRLGAEAFGDLGSDRAFGGRQGAYVGPQVKWAGRPKGLPFEIELDAGWLAAVGTDSREGRTQARLNLEFERKF